MDVKEIFVHKIKINIYTYMSHFIETKVNSYNTYKKQFLCNDYGVKTNYEQLVVVSNKYETSFLFYQVIARCIIL